MYFIGQHLTYDYRLVFNICNCVHLSGLQGGTFDRGPDDGLILPDSKKIQQLKQEEEDLQDGCWFKFMSGVKGNAEPLTIIHCTSFSESSTNGFFLSFISLFLVYFAASSVPRQCSPHDSEFISPWSSIVVILIDNMT